MVTGKGPTRSVHDANEGIVTWVREKKNSEVGSTSWIEDIMDPTMEGIYDMDKMKILVEMALKCVEEDKDARPTMSQVVEMLSSP
ncbi:putative receptor protein kinase ZmPK1 isoform X2 [Fagus crenata]